MCAETFSYPTMHQEELRLTAQQTALQLLSFYYVKTVQLPITESFLDSMYGIPALFIMIMVHSSRILTLLAGTSACIQYVQLTNLIHQEEFRWNSNNTKTLIHTNTHMGDRGVQLFGLRHK